MCNDGGMRRGALIAFVLVAGCKPIGCVADEHRAGVEPVLTRLRALAERGGDSGRGTIAALSPPPRFTMSDDLGSNAIAVDAVDIARMDTGERPYLDIATDVGCLRGT